MMCQLVLRGILFLCVTSLCTVWGLCLQSAVVTRASQLRLTMGYFLRRICYCVAGRLLKALP